MKDLDDLELQQALGKHIKRLRASRKITQYELAEKSKLKKTAIQRIERGHNSTLKTLQKLAKALEIHLSELLHIPEEHDQKQQ